VSGATAGQAVTSEQLGRLADGWERQASTAIDPSYARGLGTAAGALRIFLSAHEAALAAQEPHAADDLREPLAKARMTFGELAADNIALRAQLKAVRALAQEALEDALPASTRAVFARSVLDQLEESS
jgi:hypothetical protein